MKLKWVVTEIPPMPLKLKSLLLHLPNVESADVKQSVISNIMYTVPATFSG